MFDADHKDSGMDFAKGRVDSSDPYTRMPETEQVGSKKRHPLDSDKMEAQRRKLMALYEDELVHGDIRHLEKCPDTHEKGMYVHGDIRHLENDWRDLPNDSVVHGDIRHLEI